MIFGTNKYIAILSFLLIITACQTPNKTEDKISKIAKQLQEFDLGNELNPFASYDTEEIERSAKGAKIIVGGWSFYSFLWYLDRSGPEMDISDRIIFNETWKGVATGRTPWAKTFEYFLTAAATGDTWSQYFLGSMYFYGNGTLQDYVKAHMWVNIAASQGHRAAVDYLRKLTRDLSPEQIAEAQILARECVANNYKDC